MDLDGLLKTIEDLMEAAGLTMSLYTLRIDKTNGNYKIDLHKKDHAPVKDMKPLSEILNSVANEWYIWVHEGHIHFGIT